MCSFRQSRLMWCLIFLLGLGVFVFVGGCGSGDDDEEAQEPTPTIDRAGVVRTNADIAFAGYNDSLSTAMALQQAVDDFVAHPTNGTLQAARDAWLRAREAYQPTELYRLRIGPGPIDTLKDDGTLGEDGDGPEARINGWPLGEAFIDYVAEVAPELNEEDVLHDVVDGPDSAGSLDEPGAPMGNIIADTDMTIDKDTLKEFVEFGDDERNLATGYHAIEFLLWGQDLNARETMWTGADRDNTPGHRPVSDYSQDADCTSGEGNSRPAMICMRRAMYLQVVTELLIDDLQLLVHAWNPGGNNAGVVDYYAWYTDLSRTDVAIKKIMSGMGRMGYGELAGERINIAFRINSQEDEHSCFSDNTHRDIYLNVLGIQNMYLGNYAFEGEMIDGLGIYDVVKEADSDLAEELDMAIQTSLDLAEDISDLAEAGTPFDVQIQEMNETIRLLIIALRDQVGILVRAGEALGIDINEGDLQQDTEEDLGSV